MNTTSQYYLSLLQSCKNLTSLQQLHAFSIKTGLISDPLLFGKLLLHSAVSLPNAVDYARRLLLHTPNPDAFMYNSVIRGLSDSDSPQNSISLFKLMIKNLDHPPDSFTFAFVLKAAANMGCLRTGFQAHCQILKRGFNTHLFVGTTLISMYAECKCVWFSKKVFDEMPERNLVSWNAMATAFVRCGDMRGAEGVFGLMPMRDLDSYNLMLAGYMKTGEVGSAVRLFEGMPKKDEVSWSTMILGFSQNGFFDEAFVCFKELHNVGMRPNEVSLTGVLSACAQSGALEFAKIVHGFIEKSGLIWRAPVNNALTYAYSKCGQVDMARLVFERMPGKKSIVTWTSMIVGLAMQGYGEEALCLFHEMEESGIKPDGIAFIGILYACSHAGLVEQGCEFFDKMTKVYGIKPDIEHYGCMVDLYGRAGQLQKAYDFVNDMPIPPNAVIWRTLLGACSFYGDVKLAEQVKRRLEELEPHDSGDHVLLSNVYSVAGKWKDAATVRHSMGELMMKKTPGWSAIRDGANIPDEGIRETSTNTIYRQSVYSFSI